MVGIRGQQNRNEKEVYKFQMKYLNYKCFVLHKNKLLQRVISRILHTFIHTYTHTGFDFCKKPYTDFTYHSHSV